METTGERIGVIGSGVAGLTAADLLHRKYEVLLFETDARPGGHAHMPSAHGGTAGVDAQRGNLVRGRYLRMLAEVKRFHRQAKRLPAAKDTGDVTLGAFLAIGGYSRWFVDRAGGGEIRDDAGTPHHVVVATHADQALALPADPTRAEREVLGAFRYSAGEARLYTDTSVLPPPAGARAGWNYRAPVCGAAVRTPESVAAHRTLPEPNDGVLACAGACRGRGFHEDGCSSGARAAESLGVTW
ncbi:NAD(P)-binding protein [Amycolatopsis australiensis]|uniref:NAD(P)-binding Rossmann-like domain-containing protein n=1 Tax=Amycolatopsis australiensis TaxID=546364 RepID=A0A1K1RXX4_9PSEU|nr:NAD(P)-binding protein [Amycolatopsis australiensis]SFW76639.1 NAD(P)-binding Rossmann-like domain-containing protein [Amycolatopsis australiensis]